MVSLQKCGGLHATWNTGSLEIYYSNMSPTAFHPSHMSRLTGSDRSPLYQQTLPPPVRTDVPGTLLPLKTSSLEHLPSQDDECKTLAYDLLELSQRVLIRVTIGVCEILTLFSDFSISVFENIPELHKHKKLGQRRHSRFCSKGGKLIVRRAHNAVR